MAFKLTEDMSAQYASEASEATSLDMGAVFVGQEKILKFRIANTGSSQADFTVTITGTNTNITDDVTLSTDGDTYAASVDVDGVAANHVSDIVYCKIKPDASDPTAAGTFMIKVTE